MIHRSHPLTGLPCGGVVTSAPGWVTHWDSDHRRFYEAPGRWWRCLRCGQVADAWVRDVDAVHRR